MSTSTSKKRGPFWRSDMFVALLVVLAVLALHQLTDAIETLDRRFYDFGSVSAVIGRPAPPRGPAAADDQTDPKARPGKL